MATIGEGRGEEGGEGRGWGDSLPAIEPEIEQKLYTRIFIDLTILIRL